VLLRVSIAVIRPPFAIRMLHVTLWIVPMATRMLRMMISDDRMTNVILFY
jgi:hypothetical protein